jgi:two-component system chemotaxis response regulator CheY
MSSAPALSATSAERSILRILYADDLPELRDVARISFTREGHAIECFADGALAFTRILADPAFDLVITDHHMPNMNGIEFVKKLREVGFAGKIMVFSSELSEIVARNYREQQVDRILYKPVFPSALRNALAELFPTNSA